MKMKPTQKEYQIYRSLKKSFYEGGYPILQEKEFSLKDGYRLTFGGCVASKCLSFSNMVLVSYNTTKEYIYLSFTPLHFVIPENHFQKIEEMATGYNKTENGYHFKFNRQERIVSLAYPLDVDDRFDSGAFKMLLQKFIEEGKEVMDKIACFIQWVRKPMVAIHINPPNQVPFFPIHTHGMAKLGLPEFFLDPLSFNATENEKRFAAAVSFLGSQKNRPKLEEILNGSVVKLTNEDVDFDVGGNKTEIYCFREVSVTFSAVKLTYEPGEIEPGMRFIQMYSERDPHTLDDDYYKGGIRFGFFWND
jgi:hypothetical protein